MNTSSPAFAPYPAAQGPGAPGPEMPLPPPVPEPPASSTLPFNSDQVIATCANSSSPICYNTTISGANLITNLWFSAVLGSLCYLGFVLFRAKFRFYQARLDMPHVTHKPPALKVKGLYRLWSWIIPVFKVSDEELLLSAGMDALISVRILSFGILLFLPITVAALAILMPINYLDDYYQRQSSAAGFSDTYTTIFIRLTMSNISPGSSLLWVHFFFVYGAVFWTCWLITEHYKEYITLRQAYVIRSTELPSGALGNSLGAVDSESRPLLAARSPMKRKHMISRAATLDPVIGIGERPSISSTFPTNTGTTFPTAINTGTATTTNTATAINTATNTSTATTTTTTGTATNATTQQQQSGHRSVHRSGTLRLPRRDASGSSAGGGGGGGGQYADAEADVSVVGSMSLSMSPTISRGQHQQQQQSRFSAPPLGSSSLNGGSGGGSGSGGGGAGLGLLPSSSGGNGSGVHSDITAWPHSRGMSNGGSGGSAATSLQASGSQQQQQQKINGNNGNNVLPSSGAAAAGADWTTHDFSTEVLTTEPSDFHANITEYPTPPMRTSSSVVSSLPSLPSLPPMWSPAPQAPGSMTVERLQPPPHLRRIPSNAAVAAALEATRTTSAAEALAKIRHHRVVSGASNRSGQTPLMTPGGGNTPRGNTELPPMPSRPSTQPTSPMRNNPKTSMLSPPPDLSAVIKAVAALADEREGPVSGELATCAATAPDLGSPKGQDGVAHRWWGALSSLGNRLIERRRSMRHGLVVSSSLSITAKGSVPLGTLPGGATLAANASLYTVLVTDQPIEKLRLKKPLGNMEFWHGNKGGGTASLLGLDPTHTDELDGSIPSTPLAQRFRAAAQLDAAERGRGSGGEGSSSSASESIEMYAPGTGSGRIPSIFANQGTAAATAAANGTPAANGSQRRPAAAAERQESGVENLDDAPERGIGLSSGWSSTIQGLKQYWKHRGRYREWRRDVRWKMFNRRVRTATEMFTELFGDDFDAIVPIYPTDSVDKLIRQWDIAAAQMERAQLRLREIAEAEIGRDKGDRSAKQEKKVACLKAKISTLSARVSTLQEKITAERDAVLSDLPSTCFFATFKSQEAAAIAAQANLNPVSQRLFNVEEAPSPDDVNWPSLTRSWWQRQSRPVYVLPLILFIMLLPIGAFTGAFAQLTIAVCGNPVDGSQALAADSWYCSADPWATFLRNLITSMAPSLLLSVYHMCILPVLVYYAAQAEGQCVSLSKLDRRCADLFFYWDVFNVFLGAMLGGSILSELPTYIEQPAQIWPALSSAIPASSNFFINYVSYRALVMAWFRLFYPHQAIFTCIVKWLHILPWAKTPRDKALEAPVRNCRYGRDIGIPVLMNFVMVFAYAVVSPLILPFGLLYFMLLWAVWRYQMLYVYQRQYESGGQFWPLVAHKVVGCAFICVLFTATVLILKEAYTQAGIMLVTLPLYLLRFDIYLTNRYDAVVAQVPLMAVHAAGRVASVDPNLWTPPPLRQGACGWNPEWGKVWQWWGIPRYTL